jgi:hypothetical protein
MGHMFGFERRQIVVASFAGASVKKTAIFLGVSTEIFSKIMLPYTNCGKTTSTKRNSGRKSPLTERNRHTLRRIILKNHTQLLQHR